MRHEVAISCDTALVGAHLLHLAFEQEQFHATRNEEIHATRSKEASYAPTFTTSNFMRQTLLIKNLYKELHVTRSKEIDATRLWTSLQIDLQTSNFMRQKQRSHPLHHKGGFATRSPEGKVASCYQAACRTCKGT